jgi:hypothetical protein
MGGEKKLNRLIFMYTLKLNECRFMSEALEKGGFLKNFELKA